MIKPTEGQIHDFLTNFQDFLKNNSNIWISTHQNADLDGFSSCIGLGYLIRKISPASNIRILIPGTNKLVKKFQDKIQKFVPFLIQAEFNIDDCENLILVDTSDISLSINISSQEFGKKIPNSFDLIIIDHHKPQTQYTHPPKLSLIDEEIPSNTEILYKFYKLLEIEIPTFLADLFLMGIISDTGHFRYAKQATLLSCADLLAISSQSMTEITESMRIPISQSERVAKLKAGKRIQKIQEINGYIFVFSHLSSFESSGCNALINLGADVSFVVNFLDNVGNFRISGRARNKILHNSDFHVGNILQQVGKDFEGTGGGHSGAGGCQGKLNDYSKSKKENYVRILSESILSYTKIILSEQGVDSNGN